MSTTLLDRKAVPVWRPSDPSAVLSRTLDRGGVLAVPTGSSYALAADPASSAGVERVFRIKRRPPSRPLPVVFAEPVHLESLGVRFPEEGLGGLERAWPGGLSVVLPCRPGIAAGAGSSSLAVRIPGNRRLRELLLELGRPLTATSANRSGEPPISTPAGLVSLLAGHDAVIVDGGASPGGEPSTLVRLAGDVAEVLRVGRVPIERLRELAPGLEIRRP